MPLGLQAKLLRVLQERQVERLGATRVIDLDVRIVATSNRDLREEVAAGRFREDLYYRLNVIPLHVPPLRERRGDIVPLAEALVARAAAQTRAACPPLTAAAAARLCAYDWPGNVRELDNVMQRALILHGGDAIDANDLLFEGTAVASAALVPMAVARPASAPAAESGGELKEHERRLILGALAEGKGSRKFAAEKLGISPRTLRYKLARMRDQGIAVPGV